MKPMVIALLTAFMEEILRREYDSWAPALARALMKLACVLCPETATEFGWSADLQAKQGDGETGLFFAFGCLVGVPVLHVRVIPQRLARAWADIRDLARFSPGRTMTFESSYRITANRDSIIVMNLTSGQVVVREVRTKPGALTAGELRALLDAIAGGHFHFVRTSLKRRPKA